MNAKSEPYNGFEQGPIRPPSEAASLLLRLTRNCPWNRCAFCGLYKGRRFSVRPVAHVRQDIDTVAGHVGAITEMMQRPGGLTRKGLQSLKIRDSESDQMAFHAAMSWVQNGMQSVFLQDSNSLIMKPDDLIAVLRYIRQVFPQVDRITSYARSHTIARISDIDLARMADAGLNRIHIGLESGSDQVLKRIRKGANKATHIRAGQKIKQAGMQLSEYVMPGLGGRALWREHALETADALNQIDADFIRLRTLALPESIELYQEYESGQFQKMSDKAVAQEILMFLEALDGIGSTVKSDHILNLFQEIEGVLPEDKDRMTAVIRHFLALPPTEQMVYQIGRRAGVFSRLSDMRNPQRRVQAERICRQLRVTPSNVDRVLAELMKRFV